jgi:hypothetical protein
MTSYNLSTGASISVMAIKLVSVNIEGKKHLDTVRDFLMREDSDVVCLMEVAEQVYYCYCQIISTEFGIPTFMI